jgi:hypothetical protein
MTSQSEVSTPIPTGRGKRFLRFFSWTVAATVVFFVLLFVSSRVATQAVWRGIESERATGLSAPMPYLTQSSSLLRSVDDLQIVRAASLVLGTRDFESARTRMETVVRRYKGYFDELQVGVRQGSGRALMTTLRVPVEQFDSTLAQLKALGDAKQESQTSAESGTESDRLDARLAAARITEDRLNRLVRGHAGKLGEYLEVEQEIAKVRNEIEGLEAQQRKQAQRVRYGAIRLSLKEEYAARFDIELAAISGRLRSSIVDGLQGVIRQSSTTLSIVLLFAPSLLFWVFLLYWPVRLSWRHVRASLATRNAPGRGAVIHTD